ncbi:MAG: thioredoxin family protein [Flavobacteriia bacterium]|jgi:hypothetical protein
MDFTHYLALFKEILNQTNPEKPYDDQHYMEYVKLNQSRMNRWLKTGVLNPDLVSQVQNIQEKQNWVLITEPWCGDAAHLVPFIAKLSELSPLINLTIQLRDEDSEIDKYLTNGGKSIPILIVRDENLNDLFVWGPRPKACQELFKLLKEQNLSAEEQKTQLQAWYNADKGNSFQDEMHDLLITSNKKSVSIS